MNNGLIVDTIPIKKGMMIWCYTYESCLYNYALLTNNGYNVKMNPLTYGLEILETPNKKEN